nr:uncharacterized protein LOC117691129 [Crassostrea gigas]
MSIKCVLVFLSIHLLKQINILDAYRKPCNASLETVSRVTACPSSNSSYEAAAAEKNCLSIAADHQQCESFEYHCVLSDDMTHAVEVCAPYFNIIGSVCARFSSEYKSIIRIEGRNCNDCPFSYNSTNAFQYQECYVNLSQTFTTQLPLSATAENITAAGINDDKESNDGDSHMVIVIVILAAIFVIAVTSIVAVVKRQKIRRHFKCLKDHTDEIEMDNRDFSMNRERTSEPLLPEPNTQNNDNLPDGEGATEQFLPENATNNGKCLM